MEKVLPSAFSKEQRTRLEAVTAAKALFGSNSEVVLDIAQYIVRGAR